LRQINLAESAMDVTGHHAADPVSLRNEGSLAADIRGTLVSNLMDWMDSGAG
jgi:hypothetical protein